MSSKVDMFVLSVGDECVKGFFFWVLNKMNSTGSFGLLHILFWGHVTAGYVTAILDICCSLLVVIRLIKHMLHIWFFTLKVLCLNVLFKNKYSAKTSWLKLFPSHVVVGLQCSGGHNLLVQYPYLSKHRPVIKRVDILLYFTAWVSP